MEGDQMKMREALGMVKRYLQWLYAQGCTDRGRLSDEIDRIVSALSAPPRNCDVGTPEEQDERFKNFCLSYYEPCNVDGECWKCPLFKTKTRCPIAWAQTPYEAEEGGAK